MRMWMVQPQHMCRKHLLGEHGELHKFLHNWVKKHSIGGRIAGNAIEPSSYKARHDRLAAEMKIRGFNHQSPLEQPDFSYLPQEQQAFRVDIDQSYSLLIERCPDCRRLYNGICN